MRREARHMRPTFPRAFYTRHPKKHAPSELDPPSKLNYWLFSSAYMPEHKRSTAYILHAQSKAVQRLLSRSTAHLDPRSLEDHEFKLLRHLRIYASFAGTFHGATLPQNIREGLDAFQDGERRRHWPTVPLPQNIREALDDVHATNTAVDALPDATEAQLRHAADLRFAVRDSRLTAAAAAERDRGLEDDLQDALYVSRNDAARRAHVARDLARMRA